MRRNEFEFDFLGLHGRANGKYAIAVLAGLILAAIVAVTFIIPSTIGTEIHVFELIKAWIAR